MRAKRYTHVPILDEANGVIGVFNESAIFDYLVSKTIIEWTDTIVVAEIMDHCRLDAGHTESFHFIRPCTTEDEMVNALVNVEGEFTRVWALFVTPSGSPNEPLRRMITIWDVMSGGN
jgi:predicted transcriptional regulator